MIVSEGMLAGLRVLDLADEQAAFCSKILADLGATVIKVERPESKSRQLSVFQHYYNINKLGVTLDLTKEEGRDLLLRFIPQTDVVIENYPPGFLASINCSYETLLDANPKLILASVTGFGQNGPRSGWKSNDLIAMAYGGHMYLSGESSSPPFRAFGGQSHYVSSLFAAVGILLALIKKRKTGRGSHLDISAQEAVAGTLDHALVRYLYEGVIPHRQGSLSWNRSSFLLPCRNGHLYVNIASQWETLVAWLDSEGMAQDLTDDKWKDEAYRLEHMDHIRHVLEQWTIKHDVDELFETAQAMRFPWAPVLHPKEVVSGPQLKARHFFQWAENPEPGQPAMYPGAPYRFHEESPRMRKQAPRPGEDNERIYKEWLGLSDEEYARLTRMNVI